MAVFLFLLGYIILFFDGTKFILQRTISIELSCLDTNGLWWSLQLVERLDEYKAATLSTRV